MKRGGIRELFTDRDNLPDSGRVAVLMAVSGMLALAYVDVVVHGNKFDALGLGMGIGGAVAGLGGYLLGDSRRPPQQPRRSDGDEVQIGESP